MKIYISGLKNPKFKNESMVNYLNETDFLEEIKKSTSDSNAASFIWLYRAPWSHLIDTSDTSDTSFLSKVRNWAESQSKILKLRYQTNSKLLIINAEKIKRSIRINDSETYLELETVSEKRADNKSEEINMLELISNSIEEFEPSCWDVYEELESVAWCTSEEREYYRTQEKQNKINSFEIIETIIKGLKFNALKQESTKIKEEKNTLEYQAGRKLDLAAEENNLILKQLFLVQENLENLSTEKQDLLNEIEKTKNQLLTQTEKFKNFRTEINEKFRKKSQEYKGKMDLSKEARINLQKKIATQSDLIKELKNQHKETLNQLAQSKKEIDELQSVKTQAFETINAAEKTLHRARKIILELAAKSSL